MHTAWRWAAGWEEAAAPHSRRSGRWNAPTSMPGAALGRERPPTVASSNTGRRASSRATWMVLPLWPTNHLRLRPPFSKFASWSGPSGTWPGRAGELPLQRPPAEAGGSDLAEPAAAPVREGHRRWQPGPREVPLLDPAGLPLSDRVLPPAGSGRRPGA